VKNYTNGSYYWKNLRIFATNNQMKDYAYGEDSDICRATFGVYGC
jgi:hypothetical protein